MREIARGVTKGPLSVTLEYLRSGPVPALVNVLCTILRAGMSVGDRAREDAPVDGSR